ncbi:hypothetical protein niasHT_025658 [Heterodera trifolii]|uniref:MULE transposase domain-containing protein n=1 Tax=Heterodera trifolii TaxID=157864 RepID=A0ABD2KHW0_9BILA
MVDEEAFLAFVKGPAAFEQFCADKEITSAQSKQMLAQIYGTHLGLLYRMRKQWQSAYANAKIQNANERSFFLKCLDVLYEYLSREHIGHSTAVKPFYGYSTAGCCGTGCYTVFDDIKGLARVSKIYLIGHLARTMTNGWKTYPLKEPKKLVDQANSLLNQVKEGNVGANSATEWIQKNAIGILCDRKFELKMDESFQKLQNKFCDSLKKGNFQNLKEILQTTKIEKKTFDKSQMDKALAKDQILNDNNKRILEQLLNHSSKLIKVHEILIGELQQKPYGFIGRRKKRANDGVLNFDIEKGANGVEEGANNNARHLYTFDRASADGTTKFWRCEIKDICKGRIWTNLDDKFIRLVSPHTCPANAANVEAQKVKTVIKLRALATYEPPAVIRSEALQNVPSPAGLLVTQNSSRQIVKRARHEVNAAPAVPQSVDQLIVPPAYRTYKPIEGDEEQFLLGDSGVYYEAGNENPQRILLFGRASFGRWADRMRVFRRRHILIGTANVLPNLHNFGQSQASYERMYELLRQAWPTFSPSSFTIDFETAARNATVNAFPGCAINFCFFHFVRNLQKKIKEQSLWQRYCTDTVFAETVRMLTSVAFLPLSDIRTAVIALDTEFGNVAALRPLIDWLLNNYIGQPRPNGTWSQPLFPPEQWNVYTRTLNGEARTNNHAEAEHHRLQGAFNCRHTSIWHFIDVLRREQKGTDAKYASFLAGLEPPQKAKKYQAADDRLFYLVQNYNPVNPNNDNDHNYHINPNYHIILEFLRGISRNYHMNP